MSGFDAQLVCRPETESPPASTGIVGDGGFQSSLSSLREVLDPALAAPSAADRLAEDTELVQEFLTEAREHLASVETNLLSLEREPGNAEALNAVFRSFHTIKGLAGFLDATAVHELAHETENVLDLGRSGNLSITPEVVDLILRAADALSNCLNLAASLKLHEIPACDPALIAQLAELTRGGSAADLSPAPNLWSRLPAPAARAREAGTLRVDSSKLEYLIDTVGELVIAEAAVRNDASLARLEDPLLSHNLARLARVVQEVHKTSMSMRMVAVGSLFHKMDRLIRDLSRRLGKTVELVTIGDDVKLDRSIVEDLADPLVHMIRNAVDHGLETPSERLRAGKAEKGTVRLHAMHDASDIVLELADDGRGLDAEKILTRARKLGLVGEQDRPDEESIFNLIFEPGFSTADKVTDLSGRGVGMDVVRKQIQKLRGRIVIRSEKGKGCTFALRLPLTLAIIDGLVVGVGSQRFILPMFAVREMFSPGPETFVTLENRAEAALFRGKLLPVIRLSRLFGNGAENCGACSADTEVLIVAEARDRVFCIAVDRLIGKQEVVIKSLGKTYRDIPAISGGSILGDGRVGLIVDVNALRYRN